MRSRRPTRLLAVTSTTVIVGLLSGPLGVARAQVPGRMRSGPEPPLPPSVDLPAVTPSVHFTDVAKKLAIAYISNNDFTGRKYFPQPMCGGVALIDYDGDGHLDIFLTNGATLPGYQRPDASFYNCLLRGHGDGTFEDVTHKARLEGRNLDFSFGVAAGDIDNDGDPDLFIANAGPNALYRNDGNGTFTDITAEAGLDKPKDLLSVCAAFFDYDGDGLLDLIVSHYTYWNPSTDEVCNTSLGPVYCAPTIYRSVAHSLYRNLGNGRFQDVSVKSGFAAASSGKGMGIALADFDDNGWMDVFVANDTEPNFLYMNQGDGTFREDSWAWGVAFDDQGTVVSGMGADTADYNNDGRPDIFYNNLQTQIWALFQNEGGERFQYVSTSSGIARLSRRFSGWSNAFVDYDNDGWKDIYSANGDVDTIGDNSLQHDTMFHNVQGRGFVDVSEGLGDDFLTLGYQRGSAVGDLNDDGFPDLVVTSLNAKPRILLNSGGNGNHWLWLQLVGHTSNRDAIGAKVKVTTGSGRALYNHESLSVGFMSSSDQRLQFGLGKDDSIRSVEIRWPSGKRQVLQNVRADRHVRVEEPK